MQPQPTSRQRILVISATIGTILVIGIILLVQRVSQPSHKPVDLIGNANASENTPAPPSGSSFVGYDNLLNVGVSLDQINALEKAFQRYTPTAATGTIIDVSNGKLTPYVPDPHDPLYRPSIATTVLVSQKTTYSIRFYYWGTGSTQLLIFDSAGKTKLFDSGTITGG